MERLRTWKIETRAPALVMTLNGREYEVTNPEALAFDLNAIATRLRAGLPARADADFETGGVS